MNARAAISKALLQGRSITIKTSFIDFGITNLPREISRTIEQVFLIQVDKTKKTGVTKFKEPCYWYEYKLDQTKESNFEGIEKMKAYVLQHDPTAILESGQKVERPIKVKKEEQFTKQSLF